MNVNFPCRLPILALFFVVGTLPFLSLAQNVPPSIAQTEQISLRAGEMFEIMAVSDFPEAQVSWVLASKQSFIQAGRDRMFSVRLPTTGTYILDASIVNPERSLSIRRIFELVVAGPEGTLPPAPMGSTLVQTDPPMQNGSVALPLERSTLKISPAVPGTPGIALDADAMTDSDADGNPRNDRDTRTAFFTSNGTPLHLWLATARPEMMLTAIDTVGMGAEQQIRVQFGAAGTVPPSSLGSITVERQDDGSIAFSLSLREQERSQALLEWSFGDGEQSYQMRPIHRYGEPGDYTVAVTVRELATSRVLREERQTLTITAQAIASSSSSEASSASSAITEEPVENDEGGFSFVFLLQILGVLVGSIIVGGLLMWLVLKLRGVKLSQTIETMEEKITKKPGASAAPADVIDVAPPPLAMRRPPVKEPVEETPEPKPAPAPKPAPTPATPPSPPTPAPPKQEGPLPPWLQSTGAPSAPKPKGEAPSPLPTPPPPPPPAPKPTPKPITPPTAKIVEPPLPPPETGAGPVPPWLAKSTGSPSQQPPTPPSPPKVVPPAITEPLKPTAPIVEPAPRVPAVTAESPKPAISAVEQEKLDRERERKRRKRQRYRENLRKRQEQQAAGTLPNTSESSAESVDEENGAPEESILAPAPAAQPAADEPESDEPLFQIRAESIEEENGKNDTDSNSAS